MARNRNFWKLFSTVREPKYHLKCSVFLNLKANRKVNILFGVHKITFFYYQVFLLSANLEKVKELASEMALYFNLQNDHVKKSIQNTKPGHSTIIKKLLEPDTQYS